MAKFHHKLGILNKFLYKDFKFAENAKNGQDVVTIATAILGGALKDSKKANRMRRLLSSVKNFYLSHNSNSYSLKVAILVSKHRVLFKSDFLKLKNSMDDLPNVFNTVKNNLSEYQHRSRFLGIF